MPNSVVVGKLRAVYPSHIILGGNLRILLPAHVTMDGLEIGAKKVPDELLGGKSIRVHGACYHAWSGESQRSA